MFNINYMCYMSLLNIDMSIPNNINYGKKVLYECAGEISFNKNINYNYEKKVCLCFKHDYADKSKARQYPCSRQRLRPSDPGYCPAEIGYQPISQKVRQCLCSRQRLRPSEPRYCPAIQKQNYLVEKDYLNRNMLKIRLYICTRYSAVACLVAYNISITRLK